jgi:hypothetical protein
MQFINLTTARSCRTCPHRNRARGNGISHARWSSGCHQICLGRGQRRKVKPWHRGRIKVPMCTTPSACVFVRRFDLADAAAPGGGAHACGVLGAAEERGRERAGVLGRRLGAGVRRAGRGAGVADGQGARCDGGSESTTEHGRHGRRRNGIDTGQKTNTRFCGTWEDPKIGRKPDRCVTSGGVWKAGSGMEYYYFIPKV